MKKINICSWLEKKKDRKEKCDLKGKENVSNSAAFLLKKSRSNTNYRRHWSAPIATKTPSVFPHSSVTSLSPHTASHELKQHFVPSLMSVSPHWAKNNNLICVIGEKIWPDFTKPQKQGKWKKMSPRVHTMFHTDICMHNPDPWSLFPSKTNLCPSWTTW